MLRCMVQELKKNFYPPYVLFPVFGIACLCLTATGEIGQMGERISIFSLILHGSTVDTQEQITKSVLYLWREGLGNWLQLFAPLLLTFGYIVQLSEERHSGQVQFQLVRSGNFRYCVAKVLSGALSGGVLLVAGYLLFGGFLSLFFPSFLSFPLEERRYYLEYYFENSFSLYIAKRLAGAFLYGIFSSVFGIGVAVFFRDKYMLVCLPFLLNYIYQQILQKLMIDHFSSGAQSAEWIEAFYPSAIIRIACSRYWALSVLLMLCSYAVVAALFYRNVKRGNYGE